MQRSDSDISNGGSAARPDIYRFIHKALRACMADTLQRAGNADGADDAEVAAMLGQVRELLHFCALHLKKENAFIHPAMEARRPGSATHASAEHEHHAWAIDKLEHLAAEVESARGLEREEALLRLYRYLGIFIADNLTHMNVEETDNNAVLWATHSDAELHAIHHAIVASSSPEEKALAMRWMLPAVNHGERVILLAEMRAGMPPMAFDGVLAIACERLSGGDYAKLASALGIGADAEKLAA